MPARLKPVSHDTLVGVGGIGTGLFFELEGEHTLGRNESRPGRLLDVRDYCKLHIIAHYVAVLMGARPEGAPFHVAPVGLVGDDEAGRSMAREMETAGMDTTHVGVASGRPTLFSVCFQYPDGSGGNITTSEAAASALTPNDVALAAPLLKASRDRAIALAAPEVSIEARVALLRMAKQTGAFRALAITTAEVDRARDEGLFEMADLVALNEDEAGALAGAVFDQARPHEFLERLWAVLADEQPEIRIIMSAGKAGAWGFENGRWDYCGVPPDVPVASTAGAGDALLGGTLAGLAAGMPLAGERPWRESLSERPIETALELAVLLAAFKVRSHHTIHPEADLDALVSFAAKHGVSLSLSVTKRFVR